ncbi:MAG: hypothetical protein ACLQBD_01200 [Syntrophobacteraceae bacterium]
MEFIIKNTEFPDLREKQYMPTFFNIAHKVITMGGTVIIVVPDGSSSHEMVSFRGLPEFDAYFIALGYDTQGSP